MRVFENEVLSRIFGHKRGDAAENGEKILTEKLYSPQMFSE